MIRNILFVFGTRPEAIKLFPIINKMKSMPEYFNVIICSTGQHHEMLQHTLKVFDINPNYNLNIMINNQSLAGLTANLIPQVNDIFAKEKINLTIVQGDTTSTFVGSLCSYYNKVPISHIEAGLRTNNKYSPFPEEINRRLTDILSDSYFVPTELAKNNLIKEGIDLEKIFITGNTAIDSLIYIMKENSKINKFEKLIKCYNLNLNKIYILITGHRRESFGDSFKNICEAIKSIALAHPEIEVVYPVHLNPNVQKPVFEILNNISNIKLIPPVEYDFFVFLMQHCYLILSDSGGIQEEAPTMNKPLLVMREVTERPEGLIAGTMKLVGTGRDSIFNSANNLLTSKEEYYSMINKGNPYGDGKASERITEIIKNSF
ncbi:MAG: UDP-N-acetylglucosamine 2-epimerase (non-hydrolyzing) [Ignavibacteriaceae bacterium]|jgi:UDP-N-acetylglucosamine 2-epimerase (non-hydrolysing)